MTRRVADQDEAGLDGGRVVVGLEEVVDRQSLDPRVAPLTSETSLPVRTSASVFRRPR
jgi:hypothetical protein